MIWEDECYLLSKRKFRENANIINVFSQSKGKVSGVVYGGNSRKIKNYLQLSNKLFIIHNSKNENRLGYFKTELIKPISPLYFNDKYRTSAIISLCSILNLKTFAIKLKLEISYFQPDLSISFTASGLSFSSVLPNLIRAVPVDFTIEAGVSEVVFLSKMLISKGEIRRMIKNKGIKINSVALSALFATLPNFQRSLSLLKAN